MPVTGINAGFKALSFGKAVYDGPDTLLKQAIQEKAQEFIDAETALIKDCCFFKTDDGRYECHWIDREKNVLASEMFPESASAGAIVAAMLALVKLKRHEWMNQAIVNAGGNSRKNPPSREGFQDTIDYLRRKYCEPGGEAHQVFIRIRDSRKRSVEFWTKSVERWKRIQKVRPTAGGIKALNRSKDALDKAKASLEHAEMRLKDWERKSNPS